MLAALSLLLLLFTSNMASALTRVVVTNNSQCPADTITTPCYTNLQNAIDAAADGDTILIKPGIYTGSFSLNNRSITLAGLETATTFLSGGGAGTVLTISASTTLATTVRNLTFINAAAGIVVRNSTSSINIANNIFEVGTGSTAVQTQASQATTIQNNMFYLNGNGIVSDTNTLTIVNNIFSQNSNGLAIFPTTMSLASIQNNLFNGGTIGVPNIVLNSTDLTDPNNKLNLANVDPLFVDPDNSDITQKDFHLKSGSPCQNAGNTTAGVDSVDGSLPDIGVYGGSFSDTIPKSVTVFSSDATTSAPFDITLTWSDNPAYTVRGYKIYYGYQSNTYNGNDALASGGTGTVNSPIDAGTLTTFTLSGLSPSSVVPTTPTLFTPSPRNQSLALSWTPVDNATSYTIYSGITSTSEIVIPGITTPGYTLTGLTNGQLYMVQVSAVFQATYYLAVTAYDVNGQSGGVPGSSHESAFSSPEVVINIGPSHESPLSGVMTGMPEMINPYPNLPNSGCFIATAAYGSPNNRAVLVLREFRDRYLVTNAPGRAFIRWYYANSPAAARFITDHPALRPIVRIALAPAVASALLLTRTSLAAQAAFLVMLIALASAVFRRHRTMRSHPLIKETTE
jgi:Right handed beta helix region